MSSFNPLRRLFGVEEILPPRLPCKPADIRSKKCIRPGCGKEFREYYPSPDEASYRSCTWRFRLEPDPETSIQETKITTTVIRKDTSGKEIGRTEEDEWLREGAIGNPGCRYHWGVLETFSYHDVGTGQSLSRYQWSCCKAQEADAEGCSQAARHQGLGGRLCSGKVDITQLVPPKHIIKKQYLKEDGDEEEETQE